MKLRRLKNLKVDEISLVDKPAFLDARALLLKSAATLDGIKFAAKPAHAWAHVEGVEDSRGGKVAVIATGIVLAAGDAKPDGGRWTADEVKRLYSLWAKLGAGDKGWRLVRDTAGKLDHKTVYETVLVAWGLTDKAGLNLYAAGDSKLPADAWWVQLYIEGQTAKKLVGDKRTLNGLALVNAAVIKNAGDIEAADDWGGPDEPPGLTPEESAAWWAGRSQDDDDDKETDPAEFGAALAEATVDAIDEATGPEQAAELGAELAEVANEVLADPVEKVSASDVALACFDALLTELEEGR